MLEVVELVSAGQKGELGPLCLHSAMYSCFRHLSSSKFCSLTATMWQYGNTGGPSMVSICWTSQSFPFSWPVHLVWVMALTASCRYWSRTIARIRLEGPWKKVSPNGCGLERGAGLNSRYNLPSVLVKGRRMTSRRQRYNSGF